MEHLLVLLLRNVTHLSQQGTRRFRHHVKCACLCLQKLQPTDKHKHSNIYVTVASLLFLCVLSKNHVCRNASKCCSIRSLAGCPESPAELPLPGSVYNWFSIDQHKLFMNITPGEYSERELEGDAARDMWPLSKQNVTISKWSMFEIEQSIQMRHGMQRQINPNPT